MSWRQAKEKEIPVTVEWMESIGGLPGDEQPVEMAIVIWEKDEHTRTAEDKGPFMHLVWSSADSALFFEVYDKDGKTMAGFELDVPSTQESVLSILRALGQKIEPREQFTPPPKPELSIYRVLRTGDTFYGRHIPERAVICVSSENKGIEGNGYMLREVERLDDAGNVIEDNN